MDSSTPGNLEGELAELRARVRRLEQALEQRGIVLAEPAGVPARPIATSPETAGQAAAAPPVRPVASPVAAAPAVAARRPRG